MISAKARHFYFDSILTSEIAKKNITYYELVYLVEFFLLKEANDNRHHPEV